MESTFQIEKARAGGQKVRHWAILRKRKLTADEKRARIARRNQRRWARFLQAAMLGSSERHSYPERRR